MGKKVSYRLNIKAHKRMGGERIGGKVCQWLQSHRAPKKMVVAIGGQSS